MGNYCLAASTDAERTETRLLCAASSAAAPLTSTADSCISPPAPGYLSPTRRTVDASEMDANHRSIAQVCVPLSAVSTSYALKCLGFVAQRYRMHVWQQMKLHLAKPKHHLLCIYDHNRINVLKY